MFWLRLAGREVQVGSLLNWSSHDRLGEVMTEPFSALGSSLAIQLAIAEHAALNGGQRYANPHYADIYLFYVGEIGELPFETEPFGNRREFDSQSCKDERKTSVVVLKLEPQKEARRIEIGILLAAENEAAALRKGAAV